MKASHALPDLIEKLKFGMGMKIQKNGNPDFICFKWSIPLNGKNIGAKVFIHKNLDDMPIVFLENASTYQPLPHLMTEGYLCYIDRTSYVFNRFDPVNQTLACLLKAKEIILDIFSGKHQEALKNEFPSYWHYRWNKSTEKLTAFIDVSDDSCAKNKLFCFYKNFSSNSIFITDQPQKFLKKIDSQYQLISQGFFLETGKFLKPTKPWPPAVGYEFCNWLGLFDNSLQKKFKELALPKRNEELKFCVIKTPLCRVALCIIFSRNKHLTAYERLYNAQISLMSSNRIDHRFICSRNIPNMENLTNKKIALIGCGSVGSFLAEALIKLGAGCGLSGELALFDNEKFEAENIGRHRLGYPSIGKLKVAEMKNEMLRVMPDSKISTFNLNALELSTNDLERYDLVIDATGEEAIGNYLCSILRSKAMLSVWIEGNGWAARGLLRTNPNQACYHCIRQYEMQGKLQAIKNDSHVTLQGGCRTAYVTYSVTAAMLTACLGADMVLDWANNRFTPSLRTRLINQEKELQTNDCSPPPHPNCRACNPAL